MAAPLSFSRLLAALLVAAATLSDRAAAVRSTATAANRTKEYPVKSGLSAWVDPATPSDRQSYLTSRGRRWDLVMSDEFNKPDRDFRPGKDHLWTSLEKPDGVNGAVELYSHNMTSTACDDDGTCYFYIKAIDQVHNVTVYNQYLNPPAYQNVTFFYRAGMVQSWNKFCFQGGMVEVRAKLPGAVSNKSGNPDLKLGKWGKTTALRYYPTWPGIWMMGNLGRAIFSGSTSRMWPFSYNRCEPDIFDPMNQRISACNSTPGYGLNPNQGRGAPEIDLLEGGGVAISSSLQIGPGMPSDFRLFPVDNTTDNIYCLYGFSCKTPGANSPGVPTALFDKRGHKSWYQGLRYQSNPFCTPNVNDTQSYTVVAKAVKNITVNSCTADTCSASKDGNADLSLVDGNGTEHWGINYNGTCFPVINAYMGSFLCDPDNQNKMCVSPRSNSTPKTNTMEPFAYQMDAISSNWPVHLGAYTDYLVYQIEWVTGVNGYVRWMLHGYPIFEVTADAFENVPQNTKKNNPQKIMLEEPMYLIFNVALSSSWGATPPNAGSACRGDGKDTVAVAICDEFPMYMKIDYIRLYQDFGDDLDADNYMQVGCDPVSHPTREWIEGHPTEYEDDDNLMIDVAGGAMCTGDDDCTVLLAGDFRKSDVVSGSCINGRCACTNGSSWAGPRCTVALIATDDEDKKEIASKYGPPVGVTAGFGGVIMLLTMITMSLAFLKARAQRETAIREYAEKHKYDLSPRDRGDSHVKLQ